MKKICDSAESCRAVVDFAKLCRVLSKFTRPKRDPNEMYIKNQTRFIY